jgi:hypothetical protein
MTEYVGPFLMLDEHKQPVSWICYAKDGASIQFYQKDLTVGSRYQAFDIQRPVYALGSSTLDSKMMFFKYQDNSIYKVSTGAYGTKYYSLSLNAAKNRHFFKTAPPEYKDFTAPSLDEKMNEYFTITEGELREEFNTLIADMSSVEIGEVKAESAAAEGPEKKAYPLDEVVTKLTEDGRKLTATEWLVKGRLELYWGAIFDERRTKDEIDLACKTIFALHHPSEASPLENDAFQLRMAFLAPDCVAREFTTHQDVLISDVCNFVKDLVLCVHRDACPEQELSYTVPAVANKTVGEFNAQNEAPDGDVYEGDEARARQLALDFQLEDDAALAAILQAEENGLPAGNARVPAAVKHDLLQFRNDLKALIFPAAEGNLNIVWKILEWISNWCAILDIYCLGLGKSAAVYKEHTAKSVEEKNAANRLFRNDKSYDENIRNEIVDILKKGRG